VRIEQPSQSDVAASMLTWFFHCVHHLDYVRINHSRDIKDIIVMVGMGACHR